MLRPFALFLLALTLIPLGAAAQFSPNAAPLRLVFSPTHPRPYDEVKVTVESNLINLSAADITISVNGAVIETGSKTATFKVGGPGTKSIVKASATTPQSTETTQTTLTPADLSLIVEPDATAHPFYDGALLVPSEGRVRIVALADLRSASGAKLPESDVSYSWKVGDKQLTAESGFGRNVLTAIAPARYRDTTVVVTAISRDRSVSAQASVSIAPKDPVLRVYETDPLSGTNFAVALLDSFAFTGSEAGFRAVPYHFSESPTYSWRLNGNQSGTTDTLTVRSSGGSGSAALSASVSGQGAQAEESFTLKFERTGSSFFGL